MSHLRPSHLAFLFLLHCLFLFLSPANAVPLVLKRQSSDNQAQTLTTQTVTSTPSGDMTQTCVIVLNPITDNNGNAAFQEIKTCKLSLAGSNNNAGSGSSSTNTTSSSGNSSTDTSTTDTSTATSSSTTDSSSNGNGGLSANGVSEVPAATATDSTAATATDSSGASTTDSADAATATDGSNLGAAPAPSAGAVTFVSANPTANAGAAQTPVAAAEQAASASPSAFVVPGQSIQVLPIGLGIFGAISGIALIVVLYLTYKRRAYRKAFRARKLAEEGAAMGYGGTRT
ncbi:hypothetical protein C8R45DRAFT_1038256 [Mycena sanguinolenta]|nr:hypothetical protein C8R45DRAFT_1038256 [Mycena sanguinolenta]